MSAIATNLQAVRQRIATAALRFGRDPESVQLLAVSKTWPEGAIKEAAACGQHAFGENYVQEAVGKISSLANQNLSWHFIGPLQSNKTRLVAEQFDWVHSIDRLKIAERLSTQRPPDRTPLQICVEVNLCHENSKSGCAPADAPPLCRAIALLPHLQLRGLMAIPQPVEDFDQQRLLFRRLRQLKEQLAAEGIALDTLSMGMSHDLEAAIAEGATLVRVGTAIFGHRAPQDLVPAI